MSYFMESKLKKIPIDRWRRLNAMKNSFPWFYATLGLAIEVDTIIKASIDSSSTERE